VVKNALEPEWEARFEPSSYGFRPGKTVWDATSQVHTLLANKDRLWIVEADVKGCFDNISHDYLMGLLSTFPYATIVYAWLKAGILDQKEFVPTEYGTPQGGIISPLLMNIALDGLEKDLDIRRDHTGYATKRINRVHRTLVRYADDFIVICPSKEIAQATVIDLNKALAKRGLTLSEDKTKITHSFDGFDFLGFTFRHRILPQFQKNIYPISFQTEVPLKTRKMVSTFVDTSDKSVLSMSRKLNDIFSKHRGRSAAQLINALNPVIRGFANSKRPHSFGVAAKNLDNQLYHLQMNWMKRSHPKKSREWQVETYFTHYQSYFIDNKWTFRCPKTKIICQKFIWHMTLRKWPPVVSSYSPDDGNIKYWKEREVRKFISRNVDMQSNYDRHLADTQGLICPICDGSLLSGQFPLHRHHIVPTSQGGKNGISNMVLLHLPCHNSIHYCDNPDRWIPILLEYRLRCSRSTIWPDDSQVTD